MDGIQEDGYLWKEHSIHQVGHNKHGDYRVCRGCGRLAHRETKKPLDMDPIPLSQRKDLFYCGICEERPWNAEE